MFNHQQLSASHKQVSLNAFGFEFGLGIEFVSSPLQKLLWAVSTALKKKSVTTSHENFKNHAAVLAKVVKRLYLETMTSKLESTNATMLR